ncbi:tRNA (adenosine(37)-N6)-dimethylallyltransferase MiaA [Nannocystis sp. SCPEA4]|uniref:tRNA (adenosine(37)-N6)-dimethylallyltransferase MiaA n=1 Tax=Nannocystis sp. SCPEA4 TaxID=2996787 RepID=UPI002270CD88|nr:tRNA (adenosine(37)-N6)-dimethylallyltransferase MiaA [Nannocystis sp. SCPEA4]MCY1063009.1 tRNA (adenosine(37)-N6)-dimethylallyltransferase MiaA [Nannocystis sp. SCPEA4]
MSATTADRSDDLPHLLAVVGPTASGKSRLAVALAERLQLPIFCCDSVQIYRGLDIGSAKVDLATRQRVPHHLLDLVDPDEDFSAGDYQQAAWQLLAQSAGLFAGGTGFYLRAVVRTHSGADPVADAPVSDPRRAAFSAQWEARERERAGAVHAELEHRDPQAAAAIHPRNVVRALRALWLCEAHDRPVSLVRAEDPQRARARLLAVVLEPEVAALDRAIDDRCDAMIRAGFVAEVGNLVHAGYDSRHRSMRSLGYRQILDHLAGQSLGDAVAAIKQETRRYARRQRSYFRHQLAPERTLAVSQPIWLLSQAELDREADGIAAAAAAFLAGEASP